MKSVAVIGAGLTGLTTAYALKKKGYQVTVLEVSNKVGGVLQTTKKEGFSFESGANSIVGLKQNLLQLFEEIGADDDVIDANPAAKKRFIVRGGKLHALPQSLFQFLSTPLISFKSKIQLLKEPFVKPAPLDKEETLGEFVKRRLNDEILHYGFEPFISGIYAGAPEKLSLKHAMPKLYAMEKEYGSLTKAAIHLMREKRRTGTTFSKRIISFKNGMHTLPDKLAVQLQDNILLNSYLQSIKHTEDGWHLTWTSLNEPYSQVFEHLVLAIPAHNLVRLPFSMDVHASLSPIADIPYVPLSVINFGFKREDIKHPLDGLGFLTSSQEKTGCLGILFPSSIFPNRAPEGHVTLTAFIGGSYHPKRAGMPASDLQSIAYYDLQNLLGVKNDPVTTHHVYWPHSIPQYNVGHDRYLSYIEEAERKWPQLYIAGNFRTGVSVVNCMQSGLDLANRLSKPVSVGV